MRKQYRHRKEKRIKSKQENIIKWSVSSRAMYVFFLRTSWSFRKKTNEENKFHHNNPFQTGLVKPMLVSLVRFERPLFPGLNVYFEEYCISVKLLVHTVCCHFSLFAFVFQFSHFSSLFHPILRSVNVCCMFFFVSQVERIERKGKCALRERQTRGVHVCFPCFSLRLYIFHPVSIGCFM